MLAAIEKGVSDLLLQAPAREEAAQSAAQAVEGSLADHCVGEVLGGRNSLGVSKRVSNNLLC